MPAKHIDEGLRALSGETPIHPDSVQKFLESKFGDALEDIYKAMLELGDAPEIMTFLGKREMHRAMNYKLESILSGCSRSQRG